MRVPHGTNAANDVEVLKWLLQLNASLFEPHVGKFSMTSQQLLALFPSTYAALMH